MSQVLSVVLNRQEDSLLRLTGLCYRRGVPIESLAFSPSEQPGKVRIEAILSCEKSAADQLQRHVAKLVDVVSSEISSKYERRMTQ